MSTEFTVTDPIGVELVRNALATIAEEMGLAVNRPEDVIGDTLFVSLTVASVDSGLARVLGTVEGRFAALSARVLPLLTPR